MKGSDSSIVLVEKMLCGNEQSLARLITSVERDTPDVPEIMKAVYARTGKAHCIGITGPPGAGKSTLVDRLTATSVFKTREELVNAHVDVATIDIDIKAAIAAKASTAGLTKEAVNALLAASI